MGYGPLNQHFHGGAMRTLRLLFTVSVVLSITSPVFSQPEQDKKQEGSTPMKPAPKGDVTPMASDVTPMAPVEKKDLPPPPPGFTEVDMDSSSPVSPPLNLLDLHGYFRFRGDLLKGMDLGLALANAQNPDPYPHVLDSATGYKDVMTGANIRFRLEPTINISEDVRIHAQIDMLDNLVLGADQALADDTLYVRRSWGEVMTPLGLLRFGRMGSQWGLGLVANDGGPFHVDAGPLLTKKDPYEPMGQCFDCDYGTTVDRVMFMTKMFGHYIIPILDFTSEGLISARGKHHVGQPLDLDQLDDVVSYSLMVAKRDKPEDIQQALEQGDWVFNYGLYFTFRNQPLDYLSEGPNPNTKKDAYFDRRMNMYIPDVWVRLQYDKLRLELEAVLLSGSMNLRDTLGYKKNVDLFQFGAVLQSDYRFFNDTLLVGLELGFASGDDAPGFGASGDLHAVDAQYNITACQKGVTGTCDTSIDNFRFHPDYHVDMLLWRQIIGTVTDAYYLKPSLLYYFGEGFGAKVSTIYSSAVKTSSPRGKSGPLGLEFDVDFFYFSNDNFHAGLSYGMLIPLPGMDDLGQNEQVGGEDNNADYSAEVAHRFMCRLVLNF
jgi:uncharacterized protein (TIGR04551 family)